MTPNEHYYLILCLPKMREVAKLLGYALAFHGSAQRDLDVIGIPWIEDAASPDVLAAACANSIGATLHARSAKPHGRISYVMNWWPRVKYTNSDDDGFPDVHPYVDFCVMPMKRKTDDNSSV